MGDGWGSVIQGGFGLHGARMTNSANKKSADHAMNFERYMSNTAHQREVGDLEKAGLNPIISATGGATTPSAPAPQMENEVGSALTSANEARQIALATSRNAKEVNLLEAQKKKTDTETYMMHKGLPKMEAENMVWDKVKNVFQTGAKFEANTVKNDPMLRKSSEQMTKLIESLKTNAGQAFKKQVPVELENRR